MLFIYYFKGILSISDIQTLLNPLTDKYFGNKDGKNMLDVYNEVFDMEHEESLKVLKDLGKKYHLANTSFADFPEEDQKFLHTFLSSKLYNPSDFFRTHWSKICY